MSSAIVAKSPSGLLLDLRDQSLPLEARMRKDSLPSQIETCPKEMLGSVVCVERFASDLLSKVECAVGSVKLKLLLPVETYSIGALWWRQSFVLTKDLHDLGIDATRFSIVKIAEGEAVSVDELAQQHIEVTHDRNYVAKWYPTSKTIRISALKLRCAFTLVLFELTNASFNRELQAISLLSKADQVEKIERLEFETTKAVRERLEKISPHVNIYQFTHRHFELHYLHQELKGHVEISANYVRTQVSSKWPYFIDKRERSELAQIIDLHILVLYGPLSEKERREKKLNELTRRLEGNLQKNWDWYLSLYKTITQKESTHVF